LQVLEIVDGRVQRMPMDRMRPLIEPDTDGSVSMMIGFSRGF